MSSQECPECGYPRPVVRRATNWRQALWGGWNCPSCRVEFDRFGGRVTPRARSDASDPGGLTISDRKLCYLRPDLYGFEGWVRRLRERVGLAWNQREYLDQHLRSGDSRAALVISVAPLRVAAYTDELDGVAILAFPDEFVDEYRLRKGSKLLTVNTYSSNLRPDEDVPPGPNASGRWTGFVPIIAEFVSDDLARIKHRKAQIPEEEWRRAAKMGRAALRDRPDLVRDGRPIYSAIAATPGKGQ